MGCLTRRSPPHGLPTTNRNSKRPPKTSSRGSTPTPPPKSPNTTPSAKSSRKSPTRSSLLCIKALAALPVVCQAACQEASRVLVALLVVLLLRKTSRAPTKSTKAVCAFSQITLYEKKTCRPFFCVFKQTHAHIMNQ